MPNRLILLYSVCREMPSSAATCERFPVALADGLSEPTPISSSVCTSSEASAGSRTAVCLCLLRLSVLPSQNDSLLHGMLQFSDIAVPGQRTDFRFAGPVNAILVCCRGHVSPEKQASGRMSSRRSRRGGRCSRMVLMRRASLLEILRGPPFVASRDWWRR